MELYDQYLVKIHKDGIVKYLCEDGQFRGAGENRKSNPKAFMTRLEAENAYWKWASKNMALACEWIGQIEEVRL